MPTLNKTYTLTITPEQFLDNCSREELIELDMLLGSPRYQNRITPPSGSYESTRRLKRQLKIENPSQTKGASPPAGG